MEKGRFSDFFAREDVMVVLTSSPAGLGHVRVTEALRGGLEEGVRVEVLGLEDQSAQGLHRAASRNVILRAVMEFVQNNPLVEESFSELYRERLRRKGKEAYHRLVELVKRRRPKPKVLLIVSTHFGLGYQIAAIKNRLAEEFKLCVVLAVVVTDDSPQKVWGVVGADFLFVPSLTTKESLERYMMRITRIVPEVFVVPYPVSADFCQPLTNKAFADRKLQVNPRFKEPMKIMIPISGAAVQLNYIEEMITTLEKERIADITVVSRESDYTKRFLSWCGERKSVRVVAEIQDRDVVAGYEKEYANSVFGVEITKPSEQAFKALITPKQRGGVILLFSNPVGRQENDNLAFLVRHDLLPSPADREVLGRYLSTGERRLIDAAFLERAQHWRGLLLPSSGRDAGRAILKLRQCGVLSAMLDFSGYMDHPELRSDGVRRIWKKLATRVGEKCGIASS
ncbi:MAG: hypothetical protein A2900_05280 [Candidatus Chisholmbacteria bacterium RIFCSPLOWO2_01_FULL_50_28]|uniref:Diacylglycerol glucosyltransferase N-terminal domain-containing protein n=1 Tax=Candidatus Chisholmbacteria bacterium RIFCSPHIGHO2_01_FULL_52_32 TaxID=1797591 RepID=A0A1G1VSI3_9BACT|nr:MAG: hypothetical protein A2786_01465 [Candidatus Chisholmbacteria bacterium RIFCSPHIGHO2_01_FULL_52_32]OGY20460.1 MAG: hypothetical protein A2900_05280 [Candidatus Chisholmbacteria bacterium RIFCSPLOWO2_01_FULL_50_28]